MSDDTPPPQSPSLPPPSWRPQPAPDAAVSVGSAQDERIIQWWQRFWIGNWVGSLFVALIAFIFVAGLATLAAAFTVADDSETAEVLPLIGIVMGSIVSGEIVLDDGEASVRNIPLTLTLAVLAVAMLSFRWVTRRYPAPGPAIADALRSALIFSLLMATVMAIPVGDSRDLDPRTLSPEWLGGFAYIDDFDYESGGASVMIGAFGLMAVALLLNVSSRRAWKDRSNSFVWVPARGIILMTLLIVPLGVLPLSILGRNLGDYESSATPIGQWTIWISNLANEGALALASGMGSEVGVAYDDEFSGLGVWDLARDQSSLWWVAIPLALLFWVATAVVTGLSARRFSKSATWASLLLWAGGSLVWMSFMVLASTSYQNLGNEAASYGAHLGRTVGYLALALLPLVAVAAASARQFTAKSIRGLQNHPGRTSAKSAGIP